MSEQPWPVVLDVPVRHVPRGGRAPRDAIASLRTAFVPRRIGRSEMGRLGAAGQGATDDPYRSFEGALWIRASLPAEGGSSSGEEALRRLLLATDRYEWGAGNARWTLLSGTPLVPALPDGVATPGPRPAVGEMPTRGILDDGSERVAAAAAAQLRDDIVICGGDVFVRNPGPLVFPCDKRRQLLTLNPASVVPGHVLLPLFVPPERMEGQRAELMPFAAMLPPRFPSDSKPMTVEPALLAAPCRPGRIPEALRAPGHDVRATAIHGTAWTLRSLAKHAAGDAGAPVREALRPLADLDMLMRFGIADGAEVERALRLSRAAIEVARESVGYQAVGRLSFTFSQVLLETVLPRFEGSVPDEDAGALAGLGPA